MKLLLRLSTVLACLCLLAWGCVRQTVRIPDGPWLEIPRGWSAKTEGRHLRLTMGPDNTERCAVEIEAQNTTPPWLALEKKFAPEGVSHCSATSCQSDLAGELAISQADSLFAMRTPPGNASRLALARSINNQTVVLTFCRNNPLMPEAAMRKILRDNVGY